MSQVSSPAHEDAPIRTNVAFSYFHSFMWDNNIIINVTDLKGPANSISMLMLISSLFLTFKEIISTIVLRFA